MRHTYGVAVLGATGAVGGEVISLLEERGFPLGLLKPLGEPEDEGAILEFKGHAIPVEPLCPGTLSGIDIAFCCAPAEVARVHVPDLARQGILTIDFSSAFRLDPSVPLVIPELGTEGLGQALSSAGRRILACPGGVSGPLALVLAPLHERYGLVRAVVSTYQAASSAGKRALDELHEQAISLLNASNFTPRIFPHQLAFNVLPEVPPGGGFDEEGFSPEERGISHETARLLALPPSAITATTVFVPTFVGHALSVHVDLAKPAEPDAVKALLHQKPYLSVEGGEGSYPTVTAAVGEDVLFVGRVRSTSPTSLWLWITVDNLRRGAAMGAVRLAELAIREYKEAFSA